MYITRKVVKNISQYEKIFEYRSNKGNKITDNEILEYIKSLKIPPNYKNVKISMNRNSKLLATGYDTMGRKQYIYNQKWIESQSKKKFCKMIDFGKKINKINADIDRLLKKNGFPKDKLIAIILKIIMICHFRIGNPIGKSLYKSYGISTINKTHLYNNGKCMVIDFIGKKGVPNICNIYDKDLIKILDELKKRSKNKGDQIFFYKNDENRKLNISSCDVNDFLKKYGDFTTKDFRTWYANMYFINEIMEEVGIPEKETQRKKIVLAAVRKTAEYLHHTVAISKKKYINTEMVKLYIENPKKFERIIVKNYKTNGGLDRDQNAFIEYLKQMC